MKRSQKSEGRSDYKLSIPYPKCHKCFKFWIFLKNRIFEKRKEK
jgi:hypothetical protein